MAQKEAEEKEGVFNVVLIGALLVGGAVAGGAILKHLMPDSHVAAVVGFALLPLGVILGLSVAQGVSPTMALLNLFSVLDGRNKMNDIMPDGGAMKLQMMVMLVPVMLGLVVTGVIDMFLKPEMPFTELAIWLCGSGLGFGVVVAGLLALLTTD